MDYKIIITQSAENDLDSFLGYLIYEKKNRQAAKSLLNDFNQTVAKLTYLATSVKICSDSNLKKHNYRKIKFISHRYYILYRVVNDTVYIDLIYHELQNIAFKIK